MEIFVLACVGVASFVVLIIALVHCARKQSFTIEHDVANYRAPATQSGRTAYRARNVYQEASGRTRENGHSMSGARNEGNSSVVLVTQKGIPGVYENNNVKYNVIKETPTSRVQRKDGATSGSGSGGPTESKRDGARKEVERVPSKRKAPIVPSTSSPADATAALGHGRAASAAVVVTTPTPKVATVSSKVTSPGPKETTPVVKIPRTNSQNSSKKKAPTPQAAVAAATTAKVNTQSSQNVRSASTKQETTPSGRSTALAKGTATGTAPLKKSVVASKPTAQSKAPSAAKQSTPVKPSSPAKQTSSGTTVQVTASTKSASQLALTAKASTAVRYTSSNNSQPAKGRYVKKSSISPGRASNKRRAPIVPQEVHVTDPPVKVVPLPVQADTQPIKVEGNIPEPESKENSDVRGHNKEQEKVSRRALDRLPSLPKINVVPVVPITASVGSDSTDGPVSVDRDRIPEEDPYSVIKRRESNESKADVTDGPKQNDPVGEANDKDITTDGGIEPPYTRIKRLIENENEKGSVLNGKGIATAHVDSVHTELNDNGVGSGKQDDVAAGEINVLNDIVFVPVGTPIGDPKTQTKAEPPYAKVIKRNKRNRGNVRVHFNTDGSAAIPTKKPPTPGALVSLNDGMFENRGEESKTKENDADEVPIIPEGPDYI